MKGKGPCGAAHGSGAAGCPDAARLKVTFNPLAVICYRLLGHEARVMEMARQVDSRLQARPAFAEFMATVKEAEEAKPYRRGGHK